MANKETGKKIWDFSKWQDKTAVIDEYGVSLSYAELERQAAALNSAVSCRFLVLCLCTNTIGSLLGYVSFINFGNVPILMSAALTKESLDRLTELYHPGHIWLPSSMLGSFPEPDVVYEVYGYALIKTDFERDYELYPELALLLSTSGSTGSPKLVRQSYENINSNTAAITTYLEITESERAITTLPMNYTYGLSIINTHLACGATILLTEKSLMQKEFWNFFRDEKATSFGGVPYTYEILDKLRFYRMDLPSLRTMTQAGGAIRPDLQEKFARYAKEKDIRFFVMYGQCEATARMSYLPYKEALNKPRSIGIAIPGGEFFIESEDTGLVNEPGISGELIYKGKNVTLGYAENRFDLACGDENKGILKTGDIAYFDPDGYYYISGRKKRFLKIYGNRVNLDEMEQLLRGKSESELAVSGKDDAVYIFVTEDNLSDAVREAASELTGLNKNAFHIIRVLDIPKSLSGKIDYPELERYYEA